MLLAARGHAAERSWQGDGATPFEAFSHVGEQLNEFLPSFERFIMQQSFAAPTPSPLSSLTRCAQMAIWARLSSGTAEQPSASTPLSLLLCAWLAPLITGTLPTSTRKVGLLLRLRCWCHSRRVQIRARAGCTQSKRRSAHA
jgi:hypothetical protein